MFSFFGMLFVNDDTKQPFKAITDQKKGDIINIKLSIMRKITWLLGIFLTVFMVSCDDSVGIDGRDGLDGLDGRDGIDGVDGVNILGTVLEVQGSFTAANNFSLLTEFSEVAPNLEVFETDVVLVYILFGETTDSNGDPVDIWRLLPQTLIVDQGLLQYNFDHTFLDVNIFLETDFDTNLLLPGDTDDQVFRIAVLPAEEASSKMDTSSMSAVMSAIGVTEKEIERVVLN